MVVAGALKLPNVRNTVDMKEIGIFFITSPKCEPLLLEVINKRLVFYSDNPSKRKPLIDMCRTRWMERIKAFAHFYQAFVFLKEALSVMVCPQSEENQKKCPDFQDWDNDTKTKACSLMKALDFEFLMSFTAIYRVLAIMKYITIRLQSSSSDIYDAFCMVCTSHYNNKISSAYTLHSLNLTISTKKSYTCYNFHLLLQISEVKKEFQHIHNDVDKFAEQCFKHSCRMGESVHIEPAFPRVTSRQCHRANNPTLSPLEYYRRNLVIAVLDEVISEFDTRFSKLSITAGQLVGLVPSIICEKEVNIGDVAELYTRDLPSPKLLDRDVDWWKRKYVAMEPEFRPTSCASAIKVCTAKNPWLF